MGWVLLQGVRSAASDFTRAYTGLWKNAFKQALNSYGSGFTALKGPSTEYGNHARPKPQTRNLFDGMTYPQCLGVCTTPESSTSSNPRSRNPTRRAHPLTKTLILTSTAGRLKTWPKNKKFRKAKPLSP